MMLTEEQAKKLICPHLPVDHVKKSHHEGDYVMRVEYYARCQASECVMWRWKTEAILGDAGYIRGHKQTDRGFCGIAGKPEGA